jgi:hypothetical protein
MLRYTFQTQAGPYYDELIDFDVDTPEDIEVVYAGCDKTNRKPEVDNDWKITPNVDPKLYQENQDDLRWQQQKGREL